MLSLNIYSSMTADTTQSTDEDCVMQSKAPEQARKWTLSWSTVVSKVKNELLAKFEYWIILLFGIYWKYFHTRT